MSRIPTTSQWDNNMKVPIDNITFSDSEYVRDDDVWSAKTLYLFAKAKAYPIQDLPLWAVNLNIDGFRVDNIHDFIFQAKRVKECSLEYPIILDDRGEIADGYHRLCKAILEGKETIKAIRLEEMPAPDRKKE